MIITTKSRHKAFDNNFTTKMTPPDNRKRYLQKNIYLESKPLPAMFVFLFREKKSRARLLQLRYGPPYGMAANFQNNVRARSVWTKSSVFFLLLLSSYYFILVWLAAVFGPQLSGFPFYVCNRTIDNRNDTAILGTGRYIVHTERLNAFGCSTIRTNSQNFM